MLRPSGFVRFLAALYILLASACLALPARADATLTTLHHFGAAPDGANPASQLLLGGDGSLYGTTLEGGIANCGVVFSISPGGSLTVLHFFSPEGADGAQPAAGLILGRDGNFYGTTRAGGVNDLGTVFSMTPAGTVTVLHSFNGSDGSDPESALVQGADGNYYGTTSHGGTNDNGVVFSMTPGGALTILHTFTGSDGRNSYASLIQGGDGMLYGTTEYGGAYDYGTVFSITPGGGLTVLHSFGASTSDGRQPMAPLIQGADGRYYGTTMGGGSTNDGTVYSITSSGSLTIEHAFSNSSEGAMNPLGPITQGPDGNFYGTTGYGGANSVGTLFTMTPTGAVTLLHQFDYIDDGAHPAAGLILGPGGAFYGTTPDAGSNLNGTVFSVVPGGAFTTIHAFSEGGAVSPTSALVRGSDGMLFGTTFGPPGTLFTSTRDGLFDVLHTFIAAEGTGVNGLLLGADGKFYGTTSAGGIGTNFGTVFSITATGATTVLHTFNGSDGATPTGALIQRSDGNLYGTTSSGGANNDGAIFSVTPGGLLTVLHSFAGADGIHPEAGLVQGIDGKLYGTTASGGESGDGVVFSVTSTGTLVVLHSFSGLDGAMPISCLIQGSDGKFYGTTRSGGANNHGVIFSIASDGGFTVLHSFGGWPDGDTPDANLIQASDGLFYGTTLQGGANNNGCAFSMSPGGVVTVLYSFNGRDGAFPVAALLQMNDGAFYGTTGSGGLFNGGTLFRLDAGLPGETTPPTTTADIQGAPAGPVTITLSATDPDDPPSNLTTYYALDGGGQQTYTGPVTVTAAGSHSVAYHSVDAAGNVEATQTQSFAINYPTPSIGSLDPASAVAGSGQLTLTVNGAGFCTQSAVEWNGAPLSTTYVSSTQVKATVGAALLVTAGSASVTVVNPTPGGGASNAVSFTISTPPPSIPPVPTGLVATAGNMRVILTWSAGTEASSYNVKRGTVSGPEYVTTAHPTATGYVNSGLINRTKQYYVVGAVNPTGERANSAQASRHHSVNGENRELRRIQRCPSAGRQSGNRAQLHGNHKVQG
jgi:uncharacterized repeat protein (TIGR03803 family)